jgi:hypothetical protein
MFKTVIYSNSSLKAAEATFKHNVHVGCGAGNAGLINASVRSVTSSMIKSKFPSHLFSQHARLRKIV